MAIAKPSQIAKIKALSDPSGLPVQERRMQYRAMDRAFEESGIDPGLLAKYKAAAASQKKKLLGRRSVNPKPQVP